MKDNDNNSFRLMKTNKLDPLKDPQETVKLLSTVKELNMNI